MTLRQLRYICEIARQSLNISAAAAALHTNQSALSKQVKLLEQELDILIFVRSKGRLVDVTPEGRMVLARARVIVSEAQSIKTACQNFSARKGEPLVVAVTHTQARYFMPRVVADFRTRFPDTPISMRDAGPAQVVELVLSGEAEVGVAVIDPPPRRDLVVLPCPPAGKVVVVPRGHPLTRVKRISYADLSQYPLIMQQPNSTTAKQLMRAFEKGGCVPDVILHATDADVIKNYVTLCAGIAILSASSFDEKVDRKLKAIPAGHLFDPSVTNVFVSRSRHLQRPAFAFIEMCNPAWTREKVQRLLALDESTASLD
jgi:DNA-binding transcriptional LysR family regulator